MKSYVLLLTACFATTIFGHFLELDFDRLNGIRYNSRRQVALRRLYKQNRTRADHASDDILIPKKIHQIWIGPRPLPDKFKPLIETWKKFHPDWEYKLWTNEDVESFGLECKRQFDRAQNIGIKADILRLEILKRYGGVYVDIDFECLRPLDTLHHAYDFYVCNVKEADVIANGLIGSVSNHPVINASINSIRRLKHIETIREDQVLSLIGPFMFTRHIIRYIAKNPQNRAIVLPPDYFFPFPAHLRHMFHGRPYDLKKVMPYIHEESYAVHYWATSWTSEGGA